MGTRINSVPLGLRISTDVDEKLRKLTKKLGTTRTAVIESLIQQRAKDEGIDEIEDWRKPISVATVKTEIDFIEFEKKIAALGITGSLDPDINIRDLVYGDRG